MKGWIPRSPSEKADCLGKIVDYNDREIVAKILQLLNNRWGHHTVDRFATFYNYKVARFFSGLSGVDASFSSVARRKLLHGATSRLPVQSA